MSQNFDPDFEKLRQRAEKIRAAKREIRPMAWTIVLNVLIVNVLIVAAIVVYFYAQHFNELLNYFAENQDFDLYTARVYETLANFLLSDQYSDFVSILQMVVPIIALWPIWHYARKHKLNPLEREPVTQLGVGGFAELFAAMLGINVIGSLGVLLTETLFNGAGYSIILDVIPDDTPLSHWLLSIYAVTLAPLTEEYVYRGVVLKHLRRFGDHFAILASSILFGLMHGNLSQILSACLIGYFLAYVRIKTGSWWVCVLLHAANNLYALLMSELTDSLSLTMANLVGVADWIIFGALGVFCLWRVIKRYGSTGAEKDEVGLSVLFNAPVMVLMVFYFYEIISFVRPLG